MYAKKGDSLLYAFDFNDPSCNGEPIALSSSQNCACINSTGNLALFNKGEETKAMQNYGIDNPVRAYCSNDEPLRLCEPQTDTIFTSEKTVFATNLNMCKSPGAITHKIFANINYEWTDRCGCDDKWTPFLGMGVEAEFAPCKDCCNDCCDPCNTSCYDPCCSPCGTSCYDSCCNPCNTCCDSCTKKRAGVSQWGVWIKGGLHYD